MPAKGKEKQSIEEVPTQTAHIPLVIVNCKEGWEMWPNKPAVSSTTPVVSLKIQSQGERIQVFIWKKKKRITMQGHRFRQKPKLCPDDEVIARGFHEKRSGNDYMNRRK